MSIVKCYAPTEAASREDKDTFHSQLQSVQNGNPYADITVVLGDMDAKVGNQEVGDECTVGKFGLGTRNDNGTRFVDCCQQNDLAIGGTLFPHRNIHKDTWKSPDGRKVNQINHIAVSRSQRSSLLDVRSFRGADIGHTDHYLVIAKFRMKLRKVDKRMATKIFDTAKLKN